VGNFWGLLGKFPTTLYVKKIPCGTAVEYFINFHYCITSTNFFVDSAAQHSAELHDKIHNKGVRLKQFPAYIFGSAPKQSPCLHPWFNPKQSPAYTLGWATSSPTAYTLGSALNSPHAYTLGSAPSNPPTYTLGSAPISPLANTHCSAPSNPPTYIICSAPNSRPGVPAYTLGSPPSNPLTYNPLLIPKKSPWALSTPLVKPQVALFYCAQCTAATAVHCAQCTLLYRLQYSSYSLPLFVIQCKSYND